MAVVVNNTVAGNSDTDHITKTGAKTMVTGDAVFAVSGDIQILSLVSECYTANNATASTMAYSYVTSAPAPVTVALSSASTSLANAVVGYGVAMTNASAIGEAPTQSVSGVLLNTASRGVRVPSGQIKIVVAVASTTGTWKHYIKWEPLEAGAYAYALQ